MNPQNIKLLDELLASSAGTLFTQGVCLATHNKQQEYAYTHECPIDSLFDLASVSKLLTSTMALMLIGEGHFTLEQTLADAFRPQTLGPATAQRFADISIKQLLTHTSGLPAWYPFYTGTGSFWNILENILTHTPPEKGMIYSDLNFMLLGLLIEQYTQRSLAQNLADLNASLGTNFTYNPANTSKCVPTEFGNSIEIAMCESRGLSFNGWRSSTQQYPGQANDGNCYYFWKGEAGHAGVFGTAEDLLCLAQLYLDEGTAQGHTLIPPALAREALQDHGSRRGLGWNLESIFAHGAGHTGFTGTAIWVCPQKKAATVLLASRLALPGPPNLQEMRGQAFHLVYSALP